jgi:hypothetical protein
MVTLPRQRRHVELTGTANIQQGEKLKLESDAAYEKFFSEYKILCQTCLDSCWNSGQHIVVNGRSIRLKTGIRKIPKKKPLAD